MFKNRKNRKHEPSVLLVFCFVQIAETVRATTTEAVKTPEIRAAEMISHLLDLRKRFIKFISVLHKKVQK